MEQFSCSGIETEINNIHEKIASSAELDGQRWGTGKRNPVGAGRADFDGYVQYLKDCVTSRVRYIQNTPF